ncbi:hypothetical protein NPX13_g8606 [Xylaria arbuscula]|uniref:Alpha-type protein kinase domain-containing protein n=1 Tax=Xylaria arbuscula TaxID=114810 RepID=A0A9W8N8D3_9PEZI|nr:hypothetical protein NPX13_g8606 [Xylaria arbuscula]
MSNSRHNNATRAQIYGHVLFAQGAFKNVYEGRYTEGERAGQRCVAKQFKEGWAYEDAYFQAEMNIIHKTQSIIDDWHNTGIINKKVLLNRPDIWESPEGRRSLVEPMIDNFEKWNSNSGWVNTTGGVWSESMQALCHFSYHNSYGELLLCDLQGGCYRDSFVLTDPVILSQTPGTYGLTDMGPEAIKNFFKHHRCGRFCVWNWRTPGVVDAPTIIVQEGTTMARLPTRASRGALTQLGTAPIPVRQGPMVAAPWLTAANHGSRGPYYGLPTRASRNPLSRQPGWYH